MKKPIIMPKVGLDMSEGTIIAWLKKEGERIIAGEPLIEIETDKATTIIESADTGTLAEILVEEGETIEITKTIAWMETDD